MHSTERLRLLDLVRMKRRKHISSLLNCKESGESGVKIE
jgi:hypothetical protein